MINKPKGTYDLFKEDAVIYNYALENFKNECNLNNYNYIKTPIFESSNLFHRGVGETSDIVTKETYDFKDRGNRDLTLRPEGTAGVVRALIENKLYANTNNYLKFYYYGPMFRYERPQAGRFREFNQFGVEVFGEMNPLLDAEVINLGYKYFKNLKIDNIKIKINNLGSLSDRENYKEALVNYMKKHEDKLCEDCKVDSDKDFFKNAPSIENYLSSESLDYFSELLDNLEALEIPYEIDKNLVRGLDYYDYAVFEFVTEDDRLAGASTICAGGRYNNLVKNLDGPELNGIGFALGFERLKEIIKALDIKINEDKIDVYVASISNENASDAFLIGTNLKDCGFKVEIDYRDVSLKNKLSNANKIGASYIVIIGPDEIKKFEVRLKDALTKEERLVSINDLADELYMNL